MPGMDGLEALAEIKRLRPETAVVMISGHGTIETAVKATKLGAYDFIEKPLSLEKTLLAASRALDHGRLERQNRDLREQLERGQQIVGQSRVVEEMRQQIAIAAPTNGRVLIHGENGSGKELVARAIHAQSTRRDGPFVEVNCAAIPEELIETELFGHERGAFTGAVARRRGRFELADGGTIFLDEIADMSLKTQAKVLRVLEEQAFERVGGKDTIRVDAFASWEIDLFGRLRRLTEASRADLLASEEGRRFAVLTLVSTVASTYITLLGVDAQLDIARRTLVSRAEALRIFEARYRRGATSEFELSQSRSEYAVTKSTIPPLEQAQAQIENALSFCSAEIPAP